MKRIFRRLRTWPHLDARILHSPGTCGRCDDFPELQRARRHWEVAFTGEPATPTARACPVDAEAARARATRPPSTALKPLGATARVPGQAGASGPASTGWCDDFALKDLSAEMSARIMMMTDGLLDAEHVLRALERFAPPTPAEIESAKKDLRELTAE